MIVDTGFMSKEVESLCEKYGRDFMECRSWYDGYRVGEFEVYNPEAVIQAVTTGAFKSYWGIGNEEAVAEALDRSHIHVTSNRSYNNEDALQSAIYLAYIYALNEYTIVKEMTAGRGFADITYIPLDRSKAAIVVELKRNGSAESALTQIKERRYSDSLSTYRGDIILVGVNYDEKSKRHECRIERLTKEE